MTLHRWLLVLVGLLGASSRADAQAYGFTNQQGSNYAQAPAAALPFAPAPAPALVLQSMEASVTPPRLRPQGLLTMRSLRLAGNGAEGSRIFMGPKADISIGADAEGNFLVQKAPGATLLALDAQNVLHLNAVQTRMVSLEVSGGGGVSIGGVKQWQLAHCEGFSEEGHTALGWDKPEVTHCAGVFMLGGYCKFSADEVNKTFTGLPPHTSLRVRAVFHFIDRWIGEAGYLKLDLGDTYEGRSVTGETVKARKPVVVWSEQHAQGASTNGLSLCGQSSTPEGKFAVSIDVTVPHVEGSIQLTFGSTMENNDPCDESWGVSGIELWTRS
mmetsp:Transcript_79837/g.229182  ORF Transcript_79837/g.229182 Transcript_79837/m.229182 type:complete len:328 (-) Transcript_79837:87-1070(-)